ncbi:MAG: HPF/RaiA family ribosome-associated protein [Phycisphaerae bacterium]|nr:HPF/RaiA family ribosome-associated protein [Phycisphaerae bacterium]
MDVRLFDGPADSSPALLARVTRRIDQALKHVAQHVVRVQVRFTDINGEKKGVDKRCRIVAQVAKRSPIVVESYSTDYYRAADAAATKLRRAAEHRLIQR